MDPTLSQWILRDRQIAYVVTDRQLNVLEVGGAAGVLCDDPADCLGRSLLEWVPELVGSEAALVDVLSGSLPRFQLPWVNRETTEGQTVYLTMVGLPYEGPGGRIDGLVYLIEDVTEMGRLQQQLTQRRNELRLLQGELERQNLELVAANAELRRLDEIKSTFVSVAAHELRSPLASVLGFIEVLLDGDMGPLNGGQREYLQIVQQSAERLLTIVSELLDVARIEAGRVELVLRPTDLTLVVRSVIAAFEPQLAAKGQQLTLRSPPSLPSALCDETRAAQIIGNLLSNAIKYTPHSGRIAVALSRADEEGYVQVLVTDSGVGIVPEEQPRLFQRFFRAAGAHLSGANGAGLGLYITRSLVELHGGRIWFESEPEKGSTFYVTFAISDMPVLPL